MQVATGTVVDGKIVLEGMPLVEGASVTVVARGADEAFTLSPEDEALLVASLEEIDSGRYVGLDELLATLPATR